MNEWIRDASHFGYFDELPFEGLDKLIEAIKNDIVETERLADGDDAVTVEEKIWVASDIECWQMSKNRKWLRLEVEVEVEVELEFEIGLTPDLNCNVLEVKGVYQQVLI